MKSIRVFSAILALVLTAGCHDSTTAPVKPASIRVTAGDAQSATVGQAIAIQPTFVVSDASDKPLSGVHVTIVVTAGGGSLSGAPTKTVAPQTPVGVWTLGSGAGVQSLTVTVDGLARIVITARANPGAPAHLTALTATALTAHVGDVASPVPSVRVADQFDNPVPNAVLTVATTGGGVAPASATSNDQGIATLASWSFGTTAGQGTLTFTAGAANAAFLANVLPGDPVALTIDNAPSSALAGATLSSLAARMTDKYGNSIDGQSATIAVTKGGGVLASSSATGTPSIAIPAWTLGKSAIPQALHVTVGTFSADINVAITSGYHIDVRFVGPDMTDEQKAWFTNAAARIRGAVTGSLPPAVLTGFAASDYCGVAGLPVMNETVDGVVIYASVAPIDGTGKILAEAGPCLFRNSADGGATVMGMMIFDAADMDNMAKQGITQDVITHEMLHVVGVGTMWDARNVIIGERTVNSTFTGVAGTRGCVDTGGVSTCATGVPVENNGVSGTADAHWRESTFGNELMTGYANVGGMPFSAITVGSLGDLGYQINLLAADPYRIPGTGTSANIIPGRLPSTDWEKPLPSAAVLGATKFDSPTFIRRPK